MNKLGALVLVFAAYFLVQLATASVVVYTLNLFSRFYN